MEHSFQLTRFSQNRKLGGIPASTTSNSSCPTRCSYKGNGCYGEYGPISLNWKALSDGRRGTTLEEFCKQVKSLPRFQLWRHNQVGDLPGDGKVIDTQALRKIVNANRGRKGFTFTHYDPTDPDNAEAIKLANDDGFAINLSAENLDEADRFMAMGIAPVVVTLPQDASRPLKTPAGNTVKVCPAVVGEGTTCSLCAICADKGRKFIVGFPAHGSGKAKVEKVFFQK